MALAASKATPPATATGMTTCDDAAGVEFIDENGGGLGVPYANGKRKSLAGRIHLKQTARVRVQFLRVERASMTLIRQISSLTFLVVEGALLLTSVAAAQDPVRPAMTSLVVTPATGLTISGPHGGPLTPSSFQYRIRAS